MAGLRTLAILAAFITLATAAPVHPDAVVPEDTAASAIVPEVQAEKQALLGVKAKAKSKFLGGLLPIGKLFHGDDYGGYYGYGDGGSSDSHHEDEDPNCYDELEHQIDEQVEAKYEELLGAAGKIVPKFIKDKLMGEAKKSIAKKMTDQGAKMCGDYTDDECSAPEVQALCAKSCDACGAAAVAPAGSGAGSALPVAATPETGLFQGLAIDGMLYKH